MTFLERVLEPPSYGYRRGDALYVPTHRQIFQEFFRRLNIFESRKNWLALWGWTTTLSFGIPLAVSLIFFFNPWLLILGFVYSMVILGSYGTFWLHRYCTHRAFKFRNRWVQFLCRNAVIKIVPEEVYVVSHYVHHQFSEQPGDPYNAHAGFLYCFLADVNHQTISKALSEKDYQHLCRLMEHTSVRLNTYEQYLRWGSLCHPVPTIAHYLLNWAFWYGAFYLLGGHALATTLFGWAGVWAIGVRTFNYEGHGKGKDRRQEGIDFNRADLSVNQIWPGYVAGEWHNNHHLYPNGARSGFLPYQFDLPWIWIKSLERLGAISSYRDFRNDFYRDHYNPWKQEQEKKKSEGPKAQPLPAGS
jgi:fatty-acid desaturase